MAHRLPDLDRLARYYFTPRDPIDDEEVLWAGPGVRRSQRGYNIMATLIFREPAAAWLVLLGVLERAPSDDEVDMLAAGPLEDFVRRHADEYIDLIDERATDDPRFRRALSKMWCWPSLSPSSRDRLLRHVPDHRRAYWASCRGNRRTERPRPRDIPKRQATSDAHTRSVIDTELLTVRAANALREAGWSPERRVDATADVAALRAAGFECPTSTQLLLASIGGLTIAWQREVPPHVWQREKASIGWSPDAIRLDVPLVLRSGWTRDWVVDYETRIGAPICPIALAFSDHATVFASPDGWIYGAFDNELWLQGRSIEEALSTMIVDAVGGTVIPPLGR